MADQIPSLPDRIAQFVHQGREELVGLDHQIPEGALVRTLLTVAVVPRGCLGRTASRPQDEPQRPDRDQQRHPDPGRSQPRQQQNLEQGRQTEEQRRPMGFEGLQDGPDSNPCHIHENSSTSPSTFARRSVSL